MRRVHGPSRDRTLGDEWEDTGGEYQVGLPALVVPSGS